MSKFREGDRVRVVAVDDDDEDVGVQVGDLATVVSAGRRIPRLMFDGGMGRRFMIDEQIELVERGPVVAVAERTDTPQPQPVDRAALVELSGRVLVALVGADGSGGNDPRRCADWAVAAARALLRECEA